jgi:hypothetical protein
MTKIETGIVAKKVYVVGGETFDDYQEARTRAALLRKSSDRDALINYLHDAINWPKIHEQEVGADYLVDLLLARYDVKLRK